MNDYLEKGYAEKIPNEQLRPDNTPIWYLPHHPVVHPAKPDKVRVVFDCAATYKSTSLNHQLLQGPDQTNQLVGGVDSSLARTYRAGLGHRSYVSPGTARTPGL